MPAGTHEGIRGAAKQISRHGSCLDSFTVITRPIGPKRDLGRKILIRDRHLMDRQIDFFSTFSRQSIITKFKELPHERRENGGEGWFIACPFTPR